jgi:hypothetical protein
MFKTNNAVKRFATVLATLVAGLAFALVSSAVAAPEVKKVEIKKPELVEKVVKPEVKADSKAFFNRNQVFQRRAFINRNINRNLFFNRFLDVNEFGFDRDRAD